MSTIAKPDKSGGHWRIGRILERLEKLGFLPTAHRIARGYGLSLEEILSHDRHAYVKRARWHLWTLVRHTLCLSYPELAAVFEVDHSTILNAVHHRERELDVG